MVFRVDTMSFWVILPLVDPMVSFLDISTILYQRIAFLAEGVRVQQRHRIVG
jgi:hypothetical protein